MQKLLERFATGCIGTVKLKSVKFLRNQRYTVPLTQHPKETTMYNTPFIKNI